MKKSNENTVYLYRYIWKVKDAKNGMFNVKYVSGVEEEQKKFMGMLQANENVVCASRIYVSEINVTLTEQHEIVKKEKK